MQILPTVKTMPVHKGRESSGRTYYQWGKSGRRYYYDPGDYSSERRARARAAAQGRAVRASGYDEDSEGSNGPR